MTDLYPQKGSETQIAAMDDYRALSGTLTGFEVYLADGKAWSAASMNLWRSRFARFDVYGDTADDLLAEAKLRLRLLHG